MSPSLIFFSLLATSVYAQTGTCDPTQSSGPAIPNCPVGQVQDSQGNCCPPSGLLTTPVPTTAAAVTTVAGATTQATIIVTNALGQTVVVSSSCVDLLNPRTGVSDCPARASYCNDPTYFTVMTQQCPRTCGRCNGTSNTTSSTGCVDLLNPTTGVSDCPARASYCNDANYYNLMTVQCPRTCGRCNGTTGSTTVSSVTASTVSGACADLVNPNTGTSDCPGAAYLCNNAAYSTLMRTQCPLTCGFCSG